jgi:hypothetical protein
MSTRRRNSAISKFVTVWIIAAARSPATFAISFLNVLSTGLEVVLVHHLQVYPAPFPVLDTLYRLLDQGDARGVLARFGERSIVPGTQDHDLLIGPMGEPNTAISTLPSFPAVLLVPIHGCRLNYSVSLDSIIIPRSAASASSPCFLKNCRKKYPWHRRGRNYRIRVTLFRNLPEYHDSPVGEMRKVMVSYRNSFIPITRLSCWFLT